MKSIFVKPRSCDSIVGVQVRALAVLLLTALTSLVHADDGWWSTAGGMASFGKSHPTIRMVSEDLNIQLREGRNARVDVLFTFRNEGRATQVTMAFPETYEMRTMGSLDGFKTWVDGKRVSVQRKITKKGDPNEPDSEGSAVWLKTVPFRADQTRKVRVTYNAWYSGNTSGDLSLSYVFTTGASWKGPIGTCKITVDYSRVKSLCAPYLDLTPAHWRTLRRHVQSTTLFNWEPKDDLWMQMSPGFWNFSINGHALNPEARSYNGKPYVSGSPSDPLLPADMFDRFFGSFVKSGDDLEWTDWKNPVVAKFGKFEIKGDRMTLASGKVVRIPRGYKSIKKGNGSEAYVYLRDVVKALGGKFSYSAREERVEIRF